MTGLHEDVHKLATDFSHSKKLGEKSTALLIAIIQQMASRIDALERQFDDYPPRYK